MRTGLHHKSRFFFSGAQKILIIHGLIIDSICKARKSKAERRRIRVERVIIASVSSGTAGDIAGAERMPSISKKITAIIKTTTKTV